MDKTHKSVMGLVGVAIAAVAGLGLCDSAEAGRWLPTVENPYCAVTTYKLRNIAEQASSLTDSNDRPVIVINRRVLHEQPLYGRFLMAHECCHHSLGHVKRFREGLGHVGPQAFFYIAPKLKRLELEADCCAVRLLREKQEAESIEAGRSAMASFGNEPTGAHYPTGNERAHNISVCASLGE